MLVVDEMKEKIKRLSLPRGFACVSILIHVNGVQSAVEACEFFRKIIDFTDFINENCFHSPDVLK